MKILYFEWGENSQDDMISTLLKLGYDVVTYHISASYEEKYENFLDTLKSSILIEEYDYIFSFDFLPQISRIANEYHIKYLSWVYDSPHITLYSETVKGKYNYIFVFDYMQYLRFEKFGIPHLYHFPLAVNIERLNAQLGELTDFIEYETEISFVGSLYENNLYNQIKFLPEYLLGYLDGIMKAQKKIYGYNFIKELLTDDIVSQLEKYVVLDMDKSYHITNNEIYEDIINTKLTSLERIELLNKIADHYSLTIYSGSDPKLVSAAKNKGIISYDREMPKIFRKSKINLNITLRSIESGIPLRVVDILGAGGFLLSNYQQELADNFIDGYEIVLFDSDVDMLHKIEYYLTHEKERKEIAYRGWKKVQSKFSYETRVKDMFELVESGNISIL